LSAAASDPMRAGHDYVLIGRRAALLASFNEMVQEFHAALRRIHAEDAKAAGSSGRGPLHDTGSAPPHKPRANPRKPSEPPSRER
jgi:hypothetical protein